MKMNLGLSKGLLFAGIFSLLTGQSSSWAAGAFLNGEFSTRLFRSVTKGKDLDNSVISPYAISLAMGMAIFGARGRTAQQLGHVQPWTLRPEAFSKLWVANRLWVQREHKLLKSFLEGSDQKFDVRPWMVDFTKAPDFLSDRINGWVEEKTAHHVKDFLNIDSIDTSMKMLLSSVLFFHGDWYTQFDRSSVKEDVFTISPGKTVKLPFMQTTGMFRQKKQGDFQILEIPYFERDLVMDVFLPDAGNDLENLEEYLSNNGIEPVIADLVPTETTVILPKFEIGNTVDLTEAMKTLGVVDAFRSELADFRGMTGERDLYLARMYQKAVVSVSEAGTTASASGNLGMRKPASSPAGLVFNADRPFTFLVWNKVTKVVVLMGHFIKPAGALLEPNGK